MLYRPYGKTGKDCSVLGFGGMRFKAIDDRDACVAMMVEAAQGGVNYFDTAPAYFGVKSEQVFGAGFRELRRLGLPYYCATKTTQSTEQGIRREIEAQLRRLDLEAIDFYHVWCILTPEAHTDPVAVAKLRGFWEALGSKVDIMTADHHDMVLAITSHVPHLIAYNIVNTAAHLERVTDTEVIKFSAGGFRDFTRIAASDPTMWRDVFLANKDAVLEMLGRFNEDVSALTKAIRNGDGAALFEQFTRTRAIRKGIVDIGQDSPAPDFGRPHPDLKPEPLPKPYAADED